MTSNYLDAENAVVGSILIDPRCLPEVTQHLSEDDFGAEVNKAIFRAALALSARGQAVDPVLIRRETEAVGNAVPAQYIVQLMDTTPTAANASEYAQLVRENSLRRSVAELATRIQRAANEGDDPRELLAQMIDECNALEQSGDNKSMLSPLELVLEWYEHRENIDSGKITHKLSTGIRAYDRILGTGFGCGGHYIIAARPGNGKTTLAINIAENVAKKYGPVLFVSLEMDTKEIMAKRISRLSGIDSKIIMSEKMTPEQYEKHAKATDQILMTPLTINKQPDVTVQDIAMMARKIKNLKMLVVDYIGIVAPSKHTLKEPNHIQVKHISRELKLLARKMNIPIVTLCQISREIEKRQDKRPTMADLRDSGAIEQDADSITFLWHKEYFGQMQDRDQTAPLEVEVVVAKNRMGSTGECKFAFFPVTSKFTSATSDPRQEYRENLQYGNI